MGYDPYRGRTPIGVVRLQRVNLFFRARKNIQLSHCALLWRQLLRLCCCACSLNIRRQAHATSSIITIRAVPVSFSLRGLKVLEESYHVGCQRRVGWYLVT